VLRGDNKLLAPEETPEEVIRERQQRAAALAAVQGKLKAPGGSGESAHPTMVTLAAHCLSRTLS